MDEIRNLFEIVAGMCYEITNTTIADVFVSYSAHTDLFYVECYEDGWSEDKKSKNIMFADDMTVENLQKAITELELLKKRLRYEQEK